MDEQAGRAMAATGAVVAVGAAITPRRLLSVFGIASEEVTGAAEFGWRLFAVRTAYLSALAWGGNEAAQSSFLPIQVMDQAVFWHAYARRSVPRRAAVVAAAVSGAIIALDLRRRTVAH